MSFLDSESGRWKVCAGATLTFLVWAPAIVVVRVEAAVVWISIIAIWRAIIWIWIVGIVSVSIWILALRGQTKHGQQCDKDNAVNICCFKDFLQPLSD